MADYSIEKERQYQNEIVKLFTEELHYEYIGNLQYPKGKDARSDGKKNAPIIEERVRKYLQRLELGYTEMQISEAIRQLKEAANLPSKKKSDLLEANNRFYELLISGVKAQPNAEDFHENVKLFDFDNLQNNDFAIAEEVSFVDPFTGDFNRRPDLVVYVNGIALAVIELKRATVSLDEGIKQTLTNEIESIPSFFTTVQFTVSASDKNGFKYGTVLTPKQFWCPWKRDDHSVGNPMKDRESFQAFFDKDTFLFLCRYGVINDGGTKKVMRPHQFYALQAAMPRLKEKQSGVIWHSQGSGKSLTMVWLAKYISSNFENPRVLVVTDRTELDVQINNTFLHASENIHQAKSADDLLDTLQGGQEWLICSLIHKFGRHIDPKTGKEVIGDDEAPVPLEEYLKELENILKNKYPEGFKAKGTHKFVFVDECHRTNSGRLHEAMRKIMGDDVMFIGFTGTPLLKEDKKRGGYNQYLKAKNASENRFGPFIHKYLHKEAVDDHVILDLQYEARDVEQDISNQEKLDKKMNRLLEGLNPEAQDKIKDRWATLKKVYSTADRIESIGYSILSDMCEYPLNTGWANAMLVAGDIYSAYKYYKFFQNDCSNTLLRNRCAVVTSYDPSVSQIRLLDDGEDNAQAEIKFKFDMAKQSFDDAGVKNVEEYEAWAKRKFTTMPSQMKLLIVVDKLLTGFDAPSATYLYIDKDMRDHGLFQAICRVNRLGTDFHEDPDNPNSASIFSHKEFGMIVDFKHLFKNIQDAVTNFNDEKDALGGYDSEDIEGLLEDAITKNRKRLEAALSAYNSMRSIWEQKECKNADDVVEYFLTDYEDDPAKMRREQFYKITQGLVAAYHAISDFIEKAGYTEEQSKDIRRQVSEAANLNCRVKQASGEDFDSKQKDPDIRALLDQYITAEEAEIIVPATADFSFLDLLTKDSNTEEAAEKAVKNAGGNTKAAAEKIEGKARAVINDWNNKDTAQAQTFAQRLQQIIDEMKQNTAATTEAIKKLIELLKNMKSGGEAAPEGINTKAGKALWHNRADWTDLTEVDDVVNTIQQIEGFFATQVQGGWENRMSPAGMLCIRGLQEITGGHSNDSQISELFRIMANNK